MGGYQSVNRKGDPVDGCTDSQVRACVLPGCGRLPGEHGFPAIPSREVCLEHPYHEDDVSPIVEEHEGRQGP